MVRLVLVPFLFILLGAGQQIVNTGHHRTPVSAGLALVTGAGHQCVADPSSGSTFNCTVSAANSGDGFVIKMAGGTAITDSVGTPDTPVSYASAGAGTLYITTLRNVAAGSHTITVTGAVFGGTLSVQEYSGMNLATALGANNTGSSGDFSPATCAALTTSQTNSMTVALVTSNGIPTAWGGLTNSFVSRQTLATSADADNVATLNGSSGSSISTAWTYTPEGGDNSWGCLTVEILHQ